MRTTSFLCMVIIALSLPLPVFLFCAFLYIFFWSGYELLLVSLVIDSIFGATAFSVVYTLAVGALLITYAFLRPYLSWYIIKQ